MLCGGSRLSLPLGGRWHGAAQRRAVTDEGSPPTAGLTAARAFENSVYGAGAPSPPSEEGGGCLHKGFEQADGGRDTVSMCEST